MAHIFFLNLVQQSRQQALRANCPNVYAVVSKKNFAKKSLPGKLERLFRRTDF